MCGHLTEFGLTEARGLHRVAKLIAIILEAKDRRISDIVRQVLKIVSQIEDTQPGFVGPHRKAGHMTASDHCSHKTPNPSVS
jgi:hypothetical protein